MEAGDFNGTGIFFKMGFSLVVTGNVTVKVG